MLEPHEIRYLSAAASNPLYKVAGVAVVGCIVAAVGMYFFSLKQTVAEGERLTARWAEIEGDVAAAEELNEKKHRLEQGLNTLKGWRESNVNWNDVMAYLVDQTPGSLENIQFTRLEWDETMEGLRTQFPGEKQADFYPLKRNIDISLRGKLRSMRPERLLTQFQRNLLNGTSPVELQEVALDRYTQLRDEEGTITELTSFAFTIRLSPLEVTP